MINQNEEINKLNENAYKYLDENNLYEVSKIIQQLENYDNLTSKIHLSCLYIDFGFAKKDEKLILKGINLIEKNEKTMTLLITPSSLSYNLANGYLNYYSLTKNKVINDTNIIIKIKELYKKALKLSKDPNLKVQILVNLGNFYNYFGRYIDALEYYEEALKINPTHGMALVNKGQSLIEYRNLMNLDSPLLLDAYDCFQKALNSPKLTYEAKFVAKKSINNFEKYNKKLQFTRKNKTKINIKPNYSDLKDLSNAFCYNNKLYLNLCNFCQICESSIGDTITIRRMTTPIRNEKIQDDPFLVLSSYLNQIKMDFISARLNLILYLSKDLDLNFVNNNVVIIDTLNNEKHNIKIQLVKDSFKSFYDIFDKIAFFINEYFTLGINKKQINFKVIWYDNYNKKKLRKNLNFNNKGLKALFDIHEDIIYGEEKKFYKIRNTLTHRVLKIKSEIIGDEKDTMSEEDLFNVTIDLAKLVKNAIIYLMAMVDIEESKKDTFNSFPMFAIAVPNEDKYI